MEVQFITQIKIKLHINEQYTKKKMFFTYLIIILCVINVLVKRINDLK